MAVAETTSIDQGALQGDGRLLLAMDRDPSVSGWPVFRRGTGGGFPAQAQHLRLRHPIRSAR